MWWYVVRLLHTAQCHSSIQLARPAAASSLLPLPLLPTSACPAPLPSIDIKPCCVVVVGLRHLSSAVARPYCLCCVRGVPWKVACRMDSVSPCDTSSMCWPWCACSSSCSSRAQHAAACLAAEPLYADCLQCIPICQRCTCAVVKLTCQSHDRITWHNIEPLGRQREHAGECFNR
jgi:hypothetical protein